MILASVKRYLAERAERSVVVQQMLALAGDSFIYLAGTLMIGLGNYVLLPLYIHELTAAMFGVYALLEITILIAVAVSGVGVNVSYFKWFAELPGTERGNVFVASVVMTVIPSLLMGAGIAVIVGSPFGAQWLRTADRNFAWTLLPLVLVETVQVVFLSHLRAQRRAVAYSVITFTRMIGTVATTLWFLSNLHMGVYGVLLGRLVGVMATDLITLPILQFESFRFAAALRMVWPMTRFGMPIAWMSIMILLYDAGGRYLLSAFGTLEAVGLFTLGIKLANILAIVFIRPFGTAWSAFQFQIQHRDRAPVIYTRVLSYTFVVGAVVGALIMFAGPTLVMLFAKASYLDVLSVLPILLLPKILRPLEYWANTPFLLTGRTVWIAVADTAAVLVSLLLGWMLIPYLHVLGVALAWPIGVMAGIVFLRYAGRAHYPIPFDYRAVGFGVIVWLYAYGATLTLPRRLSLTGVGLSLLGALGLAMLVTVFVYAVVRRRNTQEVAAPVR